MWEGELSYATYDRVNSHGSRLKNVRMLADFQTFRAKAEVLAWRRHQKLIMSACDAHAAQHRINALLAFYLPYNSLMPHGALREDQLYEVRELVIRP